MKILSFDIEEWFIEKTYKGGVQWKYNLYDSMLSRILDLLDEYNTKATFFCLGSLVNDFPYVIKKIHERGHEIGSHSLNHHWVTKLSRKEFVEDTRIGINLLEQSIGEKIRSFRAPAFSIGESNKWAFEVLAENGIQNDCSIFPGMRDFGGFPTFESGEKPCKIKIGEYTLNEFPITMGKLPLVNKKIAYSGGGYFRLLPLSFVKNQMNKSDYVMCYFHLADMVDFTAPLMTRQEFEEYFKEPGTVKNRYIRYLKSNIGRKRTFNGLRSLLSSYDFMTVSEASKTDRIFPIIKL